MDETFLTAPSTQGLHVFPVCHHSPRSAKFLLDFLARVKPAHILVEGPADATRFIDALVDPGNLPPMALLAFRDDERGVTFSWPFVEFSPELQALKFGKRTGARLAFCDVPVAWRSPAPANPPVPSTSRDPVTEEPRDELPRYASLSDFWEKEMETRRQDVDAYIQVALELGRRHHLDDPWTELREAHMLAAAAKLVEEGADPSTIVIVCGAAHAPALLEGRVSMERLRSHEPGGKADVYLVPTSYRQISSVHGYGAGLAYPGYGQLLWTHRDDPERIVETALTRIARDLSAAGHHVSLADVLDGVVLARNLAALRRRHAPGVEEIVQAVETCVTRGGYEKAQALVEQMMVGDDVGMIAGALRSPVSREFFDFVNDPRHSPPLSLVDRVVQVGLDRALPIDREISVFLHRLCMAQIPFAQLPGDRRSATEEWTVKWSEGVEAALVRCADSACSIEDAASLQARALCERAGSNPEALAGLALRCARADLDDMLGIVLARLDAVFEGEVAPVAAVKSMAFLTAVESEGAPTSSARALVGPLLKKLLRTVLDRITAPGRIPDEEAAQRIEALESLGQLWGQLGPGGDETIEAGLRRVLASEEQHPRFSGAVVGLMVQIGRLPIEALVSKLRDRLEIPGEEKAAGTFLRGVIRPTGEQLLTREDFVLGSKRFIEQVDEATFLRVLPVLRLAFAELEAVTRVAFLQRLIAPPAPSSSTGTHSRYCDPEWMRHLDRRVRAELRPYLENLLEVSP